MRLHARIFIVLSVLFIAFILTRALRAEDEVMLKEIVVTALKAEEEVGKIPSNVTVITEEEIKESTATNVGELLKGEEGLVVRDFYGTGSKTSVDMRGFAWGLDTVVLVDGRKVNEIDLSAVDWNLIPLENIERIEIMRGSGSVLYGDNAMAGVINIITKKGKTLKPSAEAEVRAESFNGKSELLTLGGATDRISYYFMAKNKTTDGYRQNSAFDGRDLSGRLAVNLTERLYLDISSGYHTDHQGLPGGLTETQLASGRRQAANPFDKVDYDHYYYNLTTGFSPNERYDLEAGYAFKNRKFDNSWTSIFWGSGNFARDIDTQELKLKFTGRSVVLGRKNQLVLGAEASDSRVGQTSVSLFGTNIADVKKREEGYYIEDEFSLTEAWTLTGGGRYSKAEFDNSVSGAFPAGGKEDSREDALRAGITYNYSNGGKAFLNFSRGFRLPNADELVAFYGTISGLNPEKADTYEMGIVHPISKVASLRLTVYSMKVKDEIFFNPVTYANENIDSTWHRGAEFGFTSAITGRVTLNGNWTYTLATFESGPFSGNAIPLVPEHTAGLNADIKCSDAVTLTLNGKWVGRRYLDSDVDNSEKKLGAYTTADAKLSYDYKPLSLFLGVNNLFDEKYSDYGIDVFGAKYFYPAPERWYYAGVKASF